MTPVLCPQALTPEQGAEQASSAAKRPRNGTTQTTLPFSQSGAPGIRSAGRPAQRAEAAPARQGMLEKRKALEVFICQNGGQLEPWQVSDLLREAFFDINKAAALFLERHAKRSDTPLEVASEDEVRCACIVHLLVSPAGSRLGHGHS